MTFFDAYALVAFVADEPAAGEVEALLRAGDARVVVVNLAEAVDISQRVRGLAESEVRDALDPLLLGDVLEPAVSDEAVGWLAAGLRAKYYDRRDRPLSLADCFLLAQAIDDADSIATSDPPLAEAARSEDVDVVPLPDSAGRRP